MSFVYFASPVTCKFSRSLGNPTLAIQMNPRNATSVPLDTIEVIAIKLHSLNPVLTYFFVSGEILCTVKIDTDKTPLMSSTRCSITCLIAMSQEISLEMSENSVEHSEEHLCILLFVWRALDLSNFRRDTNAYNLLNSFAAKFIVTVNSHVTWTF